MAQGIREEIIAMLAAKRRRFSADGYHLLREEGFRHQDDRVELIRGELAVLNGTEKRRWTLMRNTMFMRYGLLI